VGGIAGHHVFPILDILSHSGDIRDQSLKLYEIGPNFTFFGPQFCGGRAPEFLDLHYKAHLLDCVVCDRVAKFHGDRRRELGDVVAKKRKKNITGKNIRPSELTFRAA